MRKEYSLAVEIPEGTKCDFIDGILKCKKGNMELKRKISVLGTEVKIDGKVIKLLCNKANKKNISMIKTSLSHIKNMFKGFEEKFLYEMEICNVHFPMNVKVENEKVIIDNFLGEKINREAKILPDVEVNIKGQKITVSGNDIEKAGQTAANIEEASRVPKKDRRVFQDGIFITNKPRGAR